MLERVPNIGVATVEDAHPAYCIAQKPEERAAVVDAFLGEHRLS